MILYWRRYGKVGGCQIAWKSTPEGVLYRTSDTRKSGNANLDQQGSAVRITGLTSDQSLKEVLSSDDCSSSRVCTLKTAYCISNKNADEKKFSSTQEIGKRHPRTSTKVDELKERKLLKTNLKTHKSWRYSTYEWSSVKERRVDALALRADERRDKLRKASGRSKYPLIRRSLNGETWLSKPQSS